MVLAVVVVRLGLTALVVPALSTDLAALVTMGSAVLVALAHHHRLAFLGRIMSSAAAAAVVVVAASTAALVVSLAVVLAARRLARCTLAATALAARFALPTRRAAALM